MNTEKTGKLISETRKEKNLTQSQLADLICVSDKAISRWETGRGFPDIDNLEALSDCLGLTVAEIIKGEKLQESVSREEIQDITEDGLSLIRRVITKKRYVNLLVGFLFSVVVLTLLIVHLTSPIYVKRSQVAVTIEELSGEIVVAVLNEDLAGIDVDVVHFPDEKDNIIIIGGYKTRLTQILGKKNHELVMLGDKEEIHAVYYYPGANDMNEIIYSTKPIDSGFVTLPRLVYNYWIFLGMGLSLVGVLFYLVFRKKRQGLTVLKIAAIPICFTVSMFLCLAGSFGEIYNASFYLSGIILLAIVLYLMVLVLISKKKRNA